MSRPNRQNNPTVRAFETVAKDYYAESFERFPVSGSGAGLARFDSELGRATPKIFEAQAKLTRRTLDSLLEMPIHDFEGNAWLDRLTLRSHLLTELMELDDLKTWRTNPLSHLDRAAEAIHSLVVRHADNLKPVAPAIISRIRAVPRHLDEAVECLRDPVPLWTHLAQQSAPGVCSLLRSLPEPLAKATGQNRATFERWVIAAEQAVQNYAQRVLRIKPGSPTGYSIGRERFEALIRHRLGLNWTAREAVSSAHGLADKLKRELQIEARRFHSRKRPHEILEEAAHQWRFDGKDLLDAYQIQMATMKARFQEAGAMTFPEGDRLLVKPVPDFLAHQIPTAAYHSPGALSKDQTGVFWVNDLSLRKETEREKRLEIEQHFGLELTAAHEAYPGHHLQFVMQHRHPSLVRKLTHHAIYYEGWTLWCEQMCVDLKVSDNPYLRLIQLHDALWRACRIMIDCGLHAGTMSFKGACELLQREVGFTPSRARIDVNWYSFSPTIPMSYLLGKMELLRLKRRKIEQEGWSLKKFNDWVLGFGAIPWSWIEASGL